MELCDINQIKALLDRHGFRFSKSMGQNFLVAPWVPERIVQMSGVDERTGVLEIGPGIGCLTAELSKTAGKVVAMELDKALRPVLAESLGGQENVEIIFSDILKIDLPAFVKEHFSDLRPVVCANLPYNITSQLIGALVVADCFDSITVMIQREAASRICAEAGNADYSVLTVFVNWYTEAEILFDVPRNCFIPQPKVVSSVIKLSRRQSPPAEVCDVGLFFRVVKAAFGQRRKTISNALSASFTELTKEQISGVIKGCGLERVRGETLDIHGFAKVTNALNAALIK